MYNTKSEPNVHHGLGMIMMCHCGLINCNVSTTLVGMLIMGEAMHMVGSEGVWEISVPSSSFCCELKTALKILFFKVTKEH